MNTVPDRSRKQRADALERANLIRTYRAGLKRDLKAGRVRIGDVLANVDDRVATMKVLDVLLATPKVGRVKALKVLANARISPSKTVGGLTVRQRLELYREAPGRLATIDGAGQAQEDRAA
jgi:hypothetical protein